MLIKKAFLRGIIPFAIMSLISFMLKFQQKDPYQVKSTFIVGIIIAVVCATSVIYDNEKWSLKKQSIIHFLIMLVTVLPCLYFSGWFPLNSTSDYLKVFSYFIICGLILWTIFYLLFTKIIDKKTSGKSK